jgi:hypothetical protein
VSDASEGCDAGRIRIQSKPWEDVHSVYWTLHTGGWCSGRTWYIAAKRRSYSNPTLKKAYEVYKGCLHAECDIKLEVVCVAWRAV